MKAKSKNAVKSELTTIDMSVEKRVEIANKMLEEFNASVVKECGLAMDVELIAHRKGIVPRQVWIDTLQKTNEKSQG